MRVKGVIWVGTSTDRQVETVAFFRDVLGMTVNADTDGFSRLLAANGDRVEVFGPETSEYGRLDTGPVAGFWVEDAARARRELIDAGVTTCTDLEFGTDGHGWFYFRAPDGNYYEICEQNRFAPASDE